jgi:phosphotransferase system enzyme I (PtsI)
MALDQKWPGLGVSSGRAAGEVWILQTFISDLPLGHEGDEINANEELDRLQRAVELTDLRLT